MKMLSQVRSRLPRSGIREVMERSAYRNGVIHLEVGEPNIDTPLYICEGAKRAIEQGFTHYTPNAGLLSLREAISHHLEQEYGILHHPDHIIVTPGAVTSIALALLTLVDSEEMVLVPDPGWPNYVQMILSQGAVPVYYPLRAANGFIPDFKELEHLVTKKTKAIIINTPGNPTGAMYSEEKLKELLAFASKHNLYVISDEVYDGIVFEQSHISPKQFDADNRVVSVFGFSKNYAMTGWRVGYAVAPPEVASVMVKLMETIVSCASSVSQKAAETAIKGPKDFVHQMAGVYKQRRDRVYEQLTKEHIPVFKPQGAFYMWIDISESGMTSRSFTFALLDQEAVAVAPGSTFGKSGDQMIRISLATSETELLEGVKRIIRFIKLRKAVSAGGGER